MLDRATRSERAERFATAHEMEEQLRGVFRELRSLRTGTETFELSPLFLQSSYALDGTLKGTPDFADVCDFERSANGLVPIDCAISEKWVFARTAAGGSSLEKAIWLPMLRSPNGRPHKHDAVDQFGLFYLRHGLVTAQEFPRTQMIAVLKGRSALVGPLITQGHRFNQRFCHTDRTLT